MNTYQIICLITFCFEVRISLQGVIKKFFRYLSVQCRYTFIKKSKSETALSHFSLPLTGMPCLKLEQRGERTMYCLSIRYAKQADFPHNSMSLLHSLKLLFVFIPRSDQQFLFSFATTLVWSKDILYRSCTD